MTPAAGQAWTFPETAASPPLVVTISRVDSAQSLGADAASPAVLSVSMAPVSEARDMGWPQVDHCPLSQASFDGGEFVMDDMSPCAGFCDGYDIWRAAFGAGEAGVFTLSPPEAYAAIVSLYAQKD